jgi:UDP-N-acetyl-D-mannosaminuronic acid dehydrogenase
MKSKIISVIGLGYIGLSTAALLATLKHKVIGIDINNNTVDLINKGKIHIFEPDLENFVKSAVSTSFLKASVSTHAADIYIICVPTPISLENGIPQPDISSIVRATKSIAPLVKPGDLVILESTSPVGTTEKLQTILEDAGVEVNKIHIAYCPERVLPGNIMTEIIDNDRIIGGLTPNSTTVVADFYRSFVSGSVLETSARTAELCKLTENSFRDVNIAFANELSLICDKENINIWELIQLANRHPRVNILQPGPGVGGHCIAVDPWFIVARDTQNAKLIRIAREVNIYKKDWVIEKIKINLADAVAKTGKIPKVACLGLAFKPNISDLRESPALFIANTLHLLGYEVLVVEPNINSHKKLTLVKLEEAINQADVIAVLVKHKEFANSLIKKELVNKRALDFCGLMV